MKPANAITSSKTSIQAGTRDPHSLSSVAVQKSASLLAANYVIPTSEPELHRINDLLVPFDSEVRQRGGRMVRTSEAER
jgi:hypothetical protein